MGALPNRLRPLSRGRLAGEAEDLGGVLCEHAIPAQVGIAAAEWAAARSGALPPPPPSAAVSAPIRERPSNPDVVQLSFGKEAVHCSTLEPPHSLPLCPALWDRGTTGFALPAAVGRPPEGVLCVQRREGIVDDDPKIRRRGSKWKCGYNCLPTQGGVKHSSVKTGGLESPTRRLGPNFVCRMEVNNP